ncbi:Uma2 family endonuclease [Streptomyces sp. NPDC004539]|uniref:Uma2 family endonuclease n=1 Tax=Streptomyces sp. NPDC004539 TaxID=3154280 RepID=UPI0033A05F34
MFTRMLVSPLRGDAPHSEVLTDLMRAFFAAGHDEKVLLGVGIWLPTGPEDYAVPDLSLVSADIDSHLVENNCYAPACFRLVLEVTSDNWRTDLHTKVGAYAAAGVPVYVVVDREHERLHVFTEPAGDTYASHHVHAPGETAVLGADVTVDVSAVLEAGR